MADTVSIVNYFSLTVPNKAGEAAKVLGALKDAGINLSGFWGYPVKSKKAQLDVVPADAKAFVKAAKKLALDIGEKKSTLLWTGEDRPGALADITAKLGAAGINLHAVQVISAGEGRCGALIHSATKTSRRPRRLSRPERRPDLQKILGRYSGASVKGASAPEATSYIRSWLSMAARPISS